MNPTSELFGKEVLDADRIVNQEIVEALFVLGTEELASLHAVILSALKDRGVYPVVKERTQ